MRGGEWRPAVLGGSARVHEDILTGRDAEIGWEDVFTDGQRVFGEGVEGGLGVHVEMERKVGMQTW